MRSRFLRVKSAGGMPKTVTMPCWLYRDQEGGESSSYADPLGPTMLTISPREI